MHEYMHKYADRSRDPEALRIARALGFKESAAWVLVDSYEVPDKGTLYVLESTVDSGAPKYVLACAWAEEPAAFHLLGQRTWDHPPYGGWFSWSDDLGSDPEVQECVLHTLPGVVQRAVGVEDTLRLTALTALVREVGVAERLPAAAHTEALYHLLGGKGSGYQPHHIPGTNDPAGGSWHLAGPGMPAPAGATPHGFPGKEPSEKARLVIEAVVAELMRQHPQGKKETPSHWQMRIKKYAKQAIRMAMLGPIGTGLDYAVPGLGMKLGKAVATGLGTFAGAELGGTPEAAFKGAALGKVIAETVDSMTTETEEEKALDAVEDGDDSIEGRVERLEALRKTPKDPKVDRLPAGPPRDKAAPDPDQCPGAFFHITTYDRMADIQSGGLVAGASSPWAGGSYDAHTNGRVFLAKGFSAAKSWWHATLYAAAQHHEPDEEGLPHLVPVMLRITGDSALVKDVRHDTRGAEREFCSWYLSAADHGTEAGEPLVEAAYLEFWDPEEKRWRLVEDWSDPSPLLGVKHTEYEGEDTLYDLFDSWQPGGFKPDTEEEAEGPSEFSMEERRGAWITRAGRLGGKGYTSRSWADRKALLDKDIEQSGYHSTLGTLLALERSGHLSDQVRDTLEHDRTYLREAYGGPGSFTVERCPFRVRKGVVAVVHEDDLEEGGWREPEEAHPDLIRHLREPGTDLLARTDRRPVKGSHHATAVQSLLFDKGLYTEAGIKKWIATHPQFRAPKIEEGSSMWRVRQHPPEAMTRGTFRTITFGKGIRAVIAVPR